MKINSAALILLLMISGCTSKEGNLMKQAEKIHKDFLTLDSHCDAPMNIIEQDYDLGIRHNKECVDFPRMKEGGLDAEFFAVFTSQGPRNDTSYQNVHNQALHIFEAIRMNVEKNASMAKLAFSPDDAYRLKKEGKIAAFIGVENGYPLARDITRVKEFYDLGARYITLCHTTNNDICDSSTDPKGPENNGLSAFGVEVVKEMNRLGMMVDVSHISDKSFYDVLKISKAPVIASHSSCRALCSSPRNMTDDMLIALKSNGGVIQICILSNYIKTPEPNPELDSRMKALKQKYGDIKNLPAEQKRKYHEERQELLDKFMKLATVSDVVDHIDHVVQVIGIDHVGIGTDFDGGGGVEGCRTSAEMKNITIELLRRGYSRTDIGKIWGGNFMRVFRQVEDIAAKSRQANS
ncbi:MAG: dipeptidase [Bacteroidales bacterium]|jgi:membrane dipeptidase